MIICPICGAENDPNNRFCDQCGARVDPAAAAGTSSSRPTGASSPTCPACGAPVLPGQAFCDNCGADLRLSGGPAPKNSSGVPSMDDLTMTALPSSDKVAPSKPEPEAAFTLSPDEETMLSTPTPPAPAKPSASAGTAAVSSPSLPSTSPVADERQLKELITSHRSTIAQLEQILGVYPAGTAPESLTTALEEAHKALAQAEKDLGTLVVKPNPADLARSEAEIERHKTTIAQLEQILHVYTEGTAPPSLTLALADAQKALAQSEAQLHALGGKLPTGPSAALPVVGPPPVVAPPTPVSEARLVMLDGDVEIKLPKEKKEIIVGREDPVSQVFPEVDLTGFGGETGGVSRQHACISFQNGQWAVTDLDSTNFTRVDGKRIEPNTPIPLHDGARIQFGRIAATFRIS